MTNQLLFLIFAIPVLSGIALLLSRRNERRRQFTQQRLNAITVGASGNDPTPRPSLIRAPSPTVVLQLPSKLGAQLDAAFQATGDRIGVLHLLVAAIIAAIIGSGFTSVILDLNPAIVMLSGIAAASAAPVLLLRFAQAHFQKRFLAVFPDALDLVVRAVKAGLPVNEALTVAGREIADPVGSELRRAIDQVQIGMSMIDALQRVADRVRVTDFRFLVVTLALQAKTGGSLAETLTNLSKVIRARKTLRQKARGLSAEAKASAVILAILPFIIGGAMWLMNRDLAVTLWYDPRGRFMLGVAFLSLVMGLVTMYMIVRRALR